MKTIIVAAWFGVVCTIAIGLEAQQRPTYRLRTDVIRVEAVVVDARGRAVHGLSASDFVVFVEGQEQPVTAFDEVRASAEPARAVAGHVDVATGVTDARGQLVVIVLDDLHIRPEWAEQARRVVRSLVGQLGDDTLIALLSTTGRHQVEFTNDRAQVIEAVEALQGAENKLVVDPPLTGAPIRQLGQSSTEDLPPGAVAPFRRVPDAAWSFGVQYDASSFLRLLANAARRLSAESARHKGVVWISAGLPTGPAASEQAEALAALREGGIPAFAIDPTGSGKAVPGGAYDGLRRVGAATPWDESEALRKTSLERIAFETGGIAITDRDDLEAGVAEVVRAFGDYYVLGFAPPAGFGGGRGRVEVAVRRPGVSVHARARFSAAAPSTGKGEKDELKPLLEGLAPAGELPLRMQAVALAPQPSGARVLVTLGVDDRHTDTMATGFASLRYRVVAVSLAQGAVTRSVSGRLAANTDEAAPSVLMSLALPPGDYQLRGAATDGVSAGSVYATVKIPSFRSTDFFLSALLLGDSERSVVRHSSVGRGRGFGPVDFAPTLDRVFDRSRRLRAYAQVRCRGAVRDIVAMVAVASADGRILWSANPDLSGSCTDFAVFEQEVPLSAVDAGVYVLRVDISSRSATASRSVRFAVR